MVCSFSYARHAHQLTGASPQAALVVGKLQPLDKSSHMSRVLYLLSMHILRYSSNLQSLGYNKKS